MVIASDTQVANQILANVDLPYVPPVEAFRKVWTHVCADASRENAKIVPWDPGHDRMVDYGLAIWKALGSPPAGAEVRTESVRQAAMTAAHKPINDRARELNLGLQHSGEVMNCNVRTQTEMTSDIIVSFGATPI